MKKLLVITISVAYVIFSYSQIWTGRVILKAPKNKIDKPVFYIKQVIDNTGNSPILGTALTKEKIPFTLYYKDTFEDKLLEISNQITNPKGKLSPLIAKIDSLIIYPYTTKKNVDVHICYMKVEFLEKTTDTYISYGLIENEKTIYGVNDFSETISYALKDCYAELNEKLKEDKVDKITASDPFENLKPNRTVTFENQFKDGVYYTFQQLKDNTPIDTIGFDYEEFDTTGIYTLTFSDNQNNQLNNIFAFVDSSNLFIKLGQLKKTASKVGFIKSHFNGRYCYFEGNVSRFIKQSHSVYTSGFQDAGTSMAQLFNAGIFGELAGGIAGGLIGLAIDKSEGSYLANSIVQVPLLPKEKETVSFLLDGFTGEVTILSKERLKVQLIKKDVKLFKEFIRGDTSREGQKQFIKKMNTQF